MSTTPIEVDAVIGHWRVLRTTRSLSMPLQSGSRSRSRSPRKWFLPFVRMFGAITTEKQKPRSSTPRLATTEMTPNLLAS